MNFICSFVVCMQLFEVVNGLKRDDLIEKYNNIHFGGEIMARTKQKNKEVEANNPVGRPPKFKTVDELQKKIDEYFESCFEEWWEEIEVDGGTRWVPRLDRNGEIKKYQKEPFTITGLALSLDTTRETLSDYESKPEFSDTIKRAKTRIENYTEKQLFDKQARNMVGIIFNLKNNYGWKETQGIEHSGEAGVRIINDIPRPRQSG